MSFSSPFSSIVITPLGDLQTDLLDRVPKESETGWDSMQDTWLVRNDSAENDPNSALLGITGFDRGTQIAGLNMWIVARSAKVVATGLFIVTVQSMGLLSERGYKVTYDAAAATQTAQNINAPNPPPDEATASLYAKVTTREAGVTATFEYVLIGSVVPTDPDFLTKWTGRNKDLPSGWEPTVPDTVWDSLTLFTYNWPNGWIFEGASMENLPGLTTVYLVKEKYAHQYPKVPG